MHIMTYVIKKSSVDIILKSTVDCFLTHYMNSCFDSKVAGIIDPGPPGPIICCDVYVH